VREGSAKHERTLEVFGYSPLESARATTIYTFGSRLRARKTAKDFVNAAAFANYLKNHPHDEFAQVHPLDDAWGDPAGDRTQTYHAR